MNTNNEQRTLNNEFTIKHGDFEGPFDLLLSLISKKKIDIYEVSISAIAEEYIAYIKKMRLLDLNIASEFLLVAAILLDLKATGLIPSEKQVYVEELSPEEVRQNLISRLMEYKKFKNAASYFQGILAETKPIYSREDTFEEQFKEFVPVFSGRIETEKLALILLDLIKIKNYNYAKARHIAPIPVSVNEQIDMLVRRLERLKRITFTSLIEEAKSKHEVIASFLAFLELYKRGVINVSQESNFEEIEASLIG